jgi:hypothetical protein
MYYKTTVVVRTADTTRAVVDDVTQAIQFGVNSNSFYKFGDNGSAKSLKSFCLGSIRYTYAAPSFSLGTDPGQMLHILWKDRGGNLPGCTPLDLTKKSPPGSIEGQELLSGDMRLPVFEVIRGNNPNTGAPDSEAIWTVKVTVAYGSTADLFTDSLYNTCVSSIVGGQFCAVSSINTNAIKRL